MLQDNDLILVTYNTMQGLGAQRNAIKRNQSQNFTKLEWDLGFNAADKENH